MTSFGIVLVFLAAALTMAANLMLRAGIDAGGGFAPATGAGIVRALTGLFTQPLFAAGFIIYFLASVVWFRVVATQPLSVAYPVLVSLTFMLVTLGAVLVFGEAFSVRKLLGLCLMLGGILVISLEKGVQW